LRLPNIVNIEYDTFMAAARTRRDPALHEAWGILMGLFHEQRRRFMSIVHELELAPQQLMALKALGERGSIPMSELAGELHCDTSNVTGIVDRLEDRGLVERRSAPHDRRVKLLELTGPGAELGREIGRRMSQPPPALQALSADDRRALRDILRRALPDE
jgi:MarR family transcriptional regulator, organic hydroperoxide resistance regulator